MSRMLFFVISLKFLCDVFEGIWSFPGLVYNSFCFKEKCFNKLFLSTVGIVLSLYVDIILIFSFTDVQTSKNT